MADYAAPYAAFKYAVLVIAFFTLLAWVLLLGGISALEKTPIGNRSTLGLPWFILWFQLLLIIAAFVVEVWLTHPLLSTSQWCIRDSVRVLNQFSQIYEWQFASLFFFCLKFGTKEAFMEDRWLSFQDGLKHCLECNLEGCSVCSSRTGKQPGGGPSIFCWQSTQPWPSSSARSSSRSRMTTHQILGSQDQGSMPLLQVSPLSSLHGNLLLPNCLALAN